MPPCVETLALLLPEVPLFLFRRKFLDLLSDGPHATTLQKARTILEQRMCKASGYLRHFTRLKQRFLSLYLRVYIQMHIALYEWLRGVARGHGGDYSHVLTADELSQLPEPEKQRPPSQIYLKNRVTEADILSGTLPPDAAPFLRILVRSFMMDRKRTNSINAQAGLCMAEITECVTASVLGTYLHAEFPAPETMTTLGDMVKALEMDVPRVLASEIGTAAAEYIAALAPIYPYAPRLYGADWFLFTDFAIARANSRIRSCPPSPTLSAVPRRTPLAKPAGDDTGRGVPMEFCAMPTGHAWVYLCPRCRNLSACIDNRPRGFHESPIPIDPWGTPGDPMPDVLCPHCDELFLYFDLHGKYLCLSEHVTIVVCPGLEGRPPCNSVTARKDEPLRHTLCSDCYKLSRVHPTHVRYCYYGRHAILDDDPHPRLQLILMQDRSAAYAVHACKAHHVPSPIYDNGYLTNVNVEQLDASLDPHADKPRYIPNATRYTGRGRGLSAKDRYRAHHSS
jgi:hypothetical protein